MLTEQLDLSDNMLEPLTPHLLRNEDGEGLEVYSSLLHSATGHIQRRILEAQRLPQMHFV
ncbi:hypothetical protein D3C78_1937410 [compost metagenome]